MKKGIILVFFLFAVFPVWSQEASPEIAELMSKAHSLAEKWDHEGSAEVFMKVLDLDPDNYEALWNAGDQYTDWADRLPDNQKEKKEEIFEKARMLCEKAIEVNPDGWEGHFRLSVALGRLALFRGGKEKVQLSQQVKETATRSLELNPEADLVHHVLGRWHQNVANLSGVLKFFAKVLYGGVPPASNEEAVEHFKKAIEINPDHIEHHLELARTYEFMKRWDLMKEPLEAALALPSVEEDDDEFKAEAKAMLSKLNY
ncbi:MAG TPA: hypothetical protein ENN03_06195 [bacterium]|nr:hypothetical protein [bacterium]